tara:strand:- start:396 stop:626 length:231 start_codon:yes stop_codon:yes gene_type:complete
MQKLFNAMSVASFVMSGAVITGAVVFYTRIPSLTKHYITEMKTELTKMVADMLPTEIEEAMPELPTETGLPIKSPF